MSFSIRTNTASLNAQRSLLSTQAVLDSSLARLSSGVRITRASDDAAGLGISTRLESRIRSQNQAVRNANDGISVVQTAEAGLGEQVNVLTRLRELAMQAASDGVGNVERGYIDKEAQKLVTELQRISQVTEYNGVKLLDGTATTLDFQVGVMATGNDVIAVSAIDAASGPTYAAPPAYVTATNDAFIASMQGGVKPFDYNVARVNAIAASSPPMSGLAPVYAADSMTNMLFGFYYAAGGLPFAGAVFPAGPARDTAIAQVAATAHGGTGGSALVAASHQAFVARMTSSAGNVGAARAAADAAATAVALAAGLTGAMATAVGSSIGTASYALFESVRISLAGGPALDPAPPGIATTTALSVLGTAHAGTGLGVVGLSLSSKPAALAALGAIDGALEKISSARGELGATGNRLQSAVSNLQSSTEALAAANSRIRDVDVAEETSRMSRAQILVQAGVSVLAQANQMPQLALKLLS